LWDVCVYGVYGLQKLDEDNDDNYTGAAWANPQQLKAHFQGVGDIKWRGLR